MDRNKLEEVVEQYYIRDIKYVKKPWDKLSHNERIDGSLYFKPKQERSCEICSKPVRGQVFNIAIMSDCIQRQCNICGFITKLTTKSGSC